MSTTSVVNVRTFPLIGGKRVLPEGAVYIGRAVPRVGLKASRWANPYRVGDADPWGGKMQIGDVLSRYRDWLKLHANPSIEELRGKVLVCWCRPKPCHGGAIIDYLETHRPVPKRGETIIFGIHSQPDHAAETAPAWPSLPTVEARNVARFRRETQRATR